MRVLLSFFVFLVFAFPFAAQAAKIDAHGAEALRGAFQGILDYEKTVFSALNHADIRYDGAVQVDKQSDHYVITIPALTVLSTQGAETEMKIAQITATAKPQNKAHYWDIVFTLPAQIVLHDKAADEDFVIHSRKRRARAVLNDQLGYFTAFNFYVGKLDFSLNGQPTPFKLGAIFGDIVMNEVEPGYFSGPGYLQLDYLSIADPEDKSSVKVDQVKLDFATEKFKAKPLTDIQHDVLQQAQTIDKMAKKELELKKSGQKPSPALLHSFATDLFASFPGYEISGGNFQYSLRNLEIHNPASNAAFAEQGFDTLKLGKAFLGLGLNGLGSDKGHLKLRAGLDSLKFYPENTEYSDIVPQHLNIDISAKNLPIDTLFGLAQNSFKMASQNPENAQMVGMGVMMRLPAILSQAGTQIVVKNNGVRSALYNFNIDGKLLTDMSAIMGFTASFKAMFEGLDDLLSVVKSKAQSSEGKTAQGLSNLTQQLEAIKAQGKPDKGGYAYDFELTPTGQFLFNDQSPMVKSPAQ